MKNETTKWDDAPRVFIGVDTGNQLVKTRNHIFSNGVKEFEDEPPLTNDVIQMDGVSEVRPNTETHPQFGVAMADAKKAGVEILFLKCHVEPDSLVII